MPDQLKEPMMPYGVPLTLSPSSLLNDIRNFEDGSSHLDKIKKHTGVTDEILASWLNISVKTYRSYKKPNVALKPDVQEHLIMLETLTGHGLEVFGSSDSFGQWLLTKNFMLDGKKPSDFLNTNSGVRLIDDRLTGMEYGDNS